MLSLHEQVLNPESEQGNNAAVFNHYYKDCAFPRAGHLNPVQECWPVHPTLIRSSQYDNHLKKYHAFTVYRMYLYVYIGIL